MQQEWVRHEFWTREIDLKAIIYAKKKGMTILMEIVEERLRNAIGKPVSQNAFDGRQTSWDGNPIHYAQHATATCCRRCMEIWHGIPLESEISQQQLSYLSNLVKAYLEERLKDKDIRPHPVSVYKAPKPDRLTGHLPLEFSTRTSDSEP